MKNRHFAKKEEFTGEGLFWKKDKITAENR